MRSNYRLMYLIAQIIIILFLSSCSSLTPTPTPMPEVPTPTPMPEVELGYLRKDYDKMPAAFVDYEPGMTIKAFDRKESGYNYKETISYPSGKTINLEFKLILGGHGSYEASINGVVKQSPSYDDYETTIKPKLKNKIAFAFMSGSVREPLYYIPMCPEAAQVDTKYSKTSIDISLDSLTLLCPVTKKTYVIQFSYERDPKTMIITDFTANINETSTK